MSIEIKDLEDKNLEKLTLIQNGKSVRFQIKDDKVWFVHNPENGNLYSIEEASNKTVDAKALDTQKKDGSLQLIADKKPLLSYRYEMTYPPVGVDSIFKKSGYIHPILTPKGDTLTRIQPHDHYHHYGLWGPWTHTRIDTMRVDFWNLGEGMGTVLFKEFKNTVSGNVFSSFTAEQEHIDFKTKGSPQVALNEDLTINLWDLGLTDRYMFDYTTSFSSPLENGILFEAYRYGGGIGLRFNERWKADNCTVLTSEGNDRLTADGTNARWCIVSGVSSDGQGTNGILFMSHPENRMHPEPMRIWPIDANEGRGDMFFEFCPIRHEQWKIEPNREYELNYRMVVFDGELSAEEAEAYWQAFAKFPEAKRIEN
ncbi:PmoA family protein [Maribacter halichondriae]|uniref:DUF6807 domain-containing protein n=1 Tax=Maribacter halichondriae TaxID=2980554 RepID=UPI00235930D7|nr:PmoA family protein [Maribacter sp. Hal144]